MRLRHPFATTYDNADALPQIPDRDMSTSREATVFPTSDKLRKRERSLEKLRINEIFYSIQGESTFAGRPCVLVRLTGCQMRCSWCDTEYSFYEGEWMTRQEILAKVAEFDCPLVELTGGEPLLQPAARPLLEDFCEAGYEVLLETGGGLSIDEIDARVHRIVDVKCPGSGESAPTPSAS